MRIRTSSLDRNAPEIEGAIASFWEGHDGYDPVWQSVSWACMLRRVGQAESATFVGAFEGESLVGYGIIEKRAIGLGKFAHFCIGGPNVRDESCLLQLEEALVDAARKDGGTFLQIEPIESLPFHLFHLGYYKGFLEQHTLLIDLTLSEDDILAQMRQKGRYNVRLAEKHGIEVVRSQDPADIEAFMRLLNETLVRDGFSGNSRAYYEALLESRTGKEEGLYLAKKDGGVLAAAIFVVEGKTAVYYYGASTSDNEKRKYMPAYLLQWEMMRAGKRAGCTRYDFLGVAPEGIEGHRLSGVSDFKRKFWGMDHAFPEKRIHVILRRSYWLIRLLRRARKLLAR